MCVGTTLRAKGREWMAAWPAQGEAQGSKGKQKTVSMGHWKNEEKEEKEKEEKEE